MSKTQPALRDAYFARCGADSKEDGIWNGAVGAQSAAQTSWWHNFQIAQSIFFCILFC